MAALFYLTKGKLNRNQLYAITITLIIHALASCFFVYTNGTQWTCVFPVPSLRMIELKPENSAPVFMDKPPTINFQPKNIRLSLPELNINSVQHTDLTISYSSSDTPYELPNKTDKLYSDVFDPVLRKKLQEAHANRKPKKQESLNTWETTGGTTFVDMGDGECIASMPKIDSRQRGTSWSMLRVKCGKTDSEKMMDNVTADLEARKHPLQTQ